MVVKKAAKIDLYTDNRTEKEAGDERVALLVFLGMLVLMQIVSAVDML